MLLKNQITKTSNLVLFIVLISVGAGSNLAFAEPLTIINATFVDSFSVATQESTPSGVAFSSDGTKMFVVGTSGDAVHEYTLGTAFDVSTASFVDSFSVAAQDGNPTDVAFSSDGEKMFILGSGDAVYEYTLTTAFDVSAATFVDSFSVTAQEIVPHGLAFSSISAKMFVVGFVGREVNEYNLTSIGPCSPPASGNWLVDSSCTMTGDATAAGNVIVPNGEVLTIPNGVTLTVPSGFNITILSGGGILIEFGGTVIVVS